MSFTPGYYGRANIYIYVHTQLRLRMRRSAVSRLYYYIFRFRYRVDHGARDVCVLSTVPNTLSRKTFIARENCAKFNSITELPNAIELPPGIFVAF